MIYTSRHTTKIMNGGEIKGKSDSYKINVRCRTTKKHIYIYIYTHMCVFVCILLFLSNFRLRLTASQPAVNNAVKLEGPQMGSSPSPWLGGKI